MANRNGVEFINTTKTIKRILFVEDDPAFRRLVFGFLNPIFEIDVAVNGTQAAELSGENPPDIAIVDMHLSGNNSTTLIRKIRCDPRLAHIPILVMSVDTGFENVTNAINAGSDEFLRKMDVSKQSLIEAIDRVSVNRELIAAAEQKSIATTVTVESDPITQLEDRIREIRDDFDFAPRDVQAKTEALRHDAVTHLRSSRQ